MLRSWLDQYPGGGAALAFFDVNASLWIGYSGFAKPYPGQDEEAVTRLRHSVDANRNFPAAFFFLGAVGVPWAAGWARSAVKTGLEIDPTFSIRRLRAGTMSGNPTYVAQRERVYDATRKADGQDRIVPKEAPGPLSPMAQ